MKVAVFRVEKPCGAGPYVENEDNPELAHMFARHGDADHLDPFDDPMLDGIYPDEVCGFATLDAVEDWFSGYEDVLADAGYSIVVYSIELQQVRYGKKQAVFVRRWADPVRTISMR